MVKCGGRQVSSSNAFCNPNNMPQNEKVIRRIVVKKIVHPKSDKLKQFRAMGMKPFNPDEVAVKYDVDLFEKSKKQIKQYQTKTQELENKIF